MFFYLSKLLWVFTQPSTVLLALLVVGLVLLASRPRLGRRCIAIGTLGLVIAGFSPLNKLLLYPLENRFARTVLSGDRPIAGIIILGGAEDTRAGPDRELAGLNESAERLTEGAALALRLPHARIVFTGGDGNLLPDDQPEAALAERLLTALGVPRDRLVIEAASRTTWENATLTRPLLGAHAGERWLLVTSAYHMPRAMGAFRQVGIAVEPWPVDFRVDRRLWLPESSFVDGLRRIDFIVREFTGLVGYYLSGRSAALFPAP